MNWTGRGIPQKSRRIKKPERASPEANHFFRGTGTVLFMDDEPMILDTVGRMLENMGFSTVCAHDGEEALRIFKEYCDAGHGFAAIILDLTIPGGRGGREILETIRKLDTTTPVFVMSGYADDTTMANARGLGFTDGIQKPFTHNELSRLFARYVPGR